MSVRADSARSRRRSTRWIRRMQVVAVVLLLVMFAVPSWLLAAESAPLATGEGAEASATGEGTAAPATGEPSSAPATGGGGVMPAPGAATAAPAAAPPTVPPAPPGVAPPIAAPGTVAPAAGPVTLDLATSAQLAAQRNLSIRAAQQNITTATQVKNQAVALTGPTVNANASYYHLDKPLTLAERTFTADGIELIVPGDTVSDANPYFFNVNARYPLYNAGRLRYGVKSATYRVEEARETTTDAELTAVLQVTRTYLAAVYGRENVRLNEESLTSYQAHLANAQSMRRNGIATDYDVIRAESAVADQQRRLTEVRNQYESSLDNLRMALALTTTTPITLQGGFFDVPPEPPVTVAEEAAVGVDPLLRSLCDKAAALHMTEKSIRAEAKPQVDLVFFANLLPRDKGYLTSPQWSVGAQLSQVVFDSGSIRARAAEQRSERARADVEAESRGNDVRLGVRSGYLDMDTARSAITAARQSVTLAHESLRLATRRFQEGVGTSLEVLDANLNLLAAETSLVQSFYQLDSAYLGVHRYLGDLLPVTQSAQAAGVAGTEEGAH